MVDTSDPIGDFQGPQTGSIEIEQDCRPGYPVSSAPRSPQDFWGADAVICSPPSKSQCLPIFCPFLLLLLL